MGNVSIRGCPARKPGDRRMGTRGQNTGPIKYQGRSSSNSTGAKNSPVAHLVRGGSGVNLMSNVSCKDNKRK